MQNLMQSMTCGMRNREFMPGSPSPADGRADFERRFAGCGCQRVNRTAVQVTFRRKIRFRGNFLFAWLYNQEDGGTSSPATGNQITWKSKIVN